MAADPRAILSNIYASELGRAPDDGGLNYYISEIQKGKTADQIRAEISSSAEGAAFDARKPADVVSALYKQELGRDVDPGGLETYSNLLSAGTSAEDIRRMLNASEEGVAYDTSAVNRAYMDQLGRAPDPGGLNTYLDLVQQGYTQDDLERVLNASEEGRAFDTSTLNQAYQDVLGRTADASGRDYWLNQMAQNLSIDPSNIAQYLEGGRQGVDTRATTTGATTGTTTTGGAVTNANISGGLPGAGVEQRIASGALPQRVIIGGAPITLGGGYAAYPYGTQALADQLGLPMLKLQDVVTAGNMPQGLVAAPTTTSGLNFQQTTTPTNPFTLGGAANPYANVNYPSPWFVNADQFNPYGPITGGVQITNPAPAPLGGAVVAPGGVTGTTLNNPTGTTTNP